MQIVRSFLAMAIASGMFLAASPSNAAVTGNELLDACNNSDPYRQSFCMGYIIGIFEGTIFGSFVTNIYYLPNDFPMKDVNIAVNLTTRFCIPDEVSRGQIVDVAIQYLRQNPKDRHEAARAMVYASLVQAWPCQ